MFERPNYLLGKGQNLTIEIDPPGRRGNKHAPYSFEEAKAALEPKGNLASRELDALPAIACPGDQAVVALTLHPAYLAKTHYPAGLLAAAGLRTVGSRATTVVLRKPMGLDPFERVPTTNLFVAGTRQQFRRFSRTIVQWNEGSGEGKDLIKIEDFRLVSPTERVKPLRSDSPVPLMEIVLHSSGSSSDVILNGFRDFLADLRIQVDLGRRLVADTLCFVPVRIPRDLIPELARFSFMRVAREMPSLRPMQPLLRIVSPDHIPFACQLPFDGPLAPDVRVAVFDGGMPSEPDLSQWVRPLDAPGVGPPSPVYTRHGLAVTSALLFGSIDESQALPTPYVHVDHYRVLDDETARDPQQELYPVLKRILSVLESTDYEFAALCIGPDTPVEDDDVHPWTMLLDPLLARGDLLLTIAAGNSGERDAASGLNRIQPPADCVNGLSVGACDSQSRHWGRATYSSVGFGRRPGRVRPELLGFRGSTREPFWALGSGRLTMAVPMAGTSFASPTVLRSGIGVRAHLGPELTPLAIKALLIHRSEDSILEKHDLAQLGWGRVQADLAEMLTCKDDLVHVVYQGVLEPRKYLRARVPFPSGEIPGNVNITCTICIASATDPEHPPNYTRNGVEVVFRPNMKRQSIRKDKKSGERVASKLPATKPFFGSMPYMSESELREEAQKWETTLHTFKMFRGTSLSDPVFDIHHNPRFGGADPTHAEAIPYAMIVTVRANQVKDFYNQVFIRYKGQLEPLVPILDLFLPT